jgi:hypothetical protein
VFGVVGSPDNTQKRMPYKPFFKKIAKGHFSGKSWAMIRACQPLARGPSINLGGSAGIRPAGLINQGNR